MCTVQLYNLKNLCGVQPSLLSIPRAPREFLNQLIILYVVSQIFAAQSSV